jgi:hypothetical protein
MGLGGGGERVLQSTLELFPFLHTVRRRLAPTNPAERVILDRHTGVILDQHTGSDSVW